MASIHFVRSRANASLISSLFTRFLCSKSARFVDSRIRLAIKGVCFTHSLHSYEYNHSDLTNSGQSGENGSLRRGNCLLRLMGCFRAPPPLVENGPSQKAHYEVYDYHGFKPLGWCSEEQPKTRQGRPLQAQICALNLRIARGKIVLTCFRTK